MADIKRKVPNLRFKGFTDYWEQHKLGDIAKVTKLAGFEFTKYINYSSKGKILAIRGLNIKDGKFNLQDVKYIDNSDFNKLTRSKLRQDDILFTYVGTIGNSAIVPAGVKWYLAPNVCLIRTQTENAKFISHLIQSDKFQHQEIPKWITTSSQPALSMENIRKFSIILPTISEQLKISNLVSIIDTIITLQQRKLELLKQLKKGFLQKMFAEKNSKQPVLRFKGFHDDWEQRKLSELIQKGGSGGTPKSTNKAYYNGNIPFLGISDISKSNGYIDDTEKYISEKGLDNSSAWIVPKGAISLAMYASVGKLAILNTDAATSQAFYNMVFEDVSIRDYVYHRLGKANEFGEWTRLISTGTQSNLNADKVKNFRIQVPQIIDEIKNISTFFNQLDSLIALHQRKQNHLKLLKKSLLQQMFM